MGGREMRRRLPKYVQAWVDLESGKPRHYFRRPGFKRIRLPGLPWSEEFMRAWSAAMNGERLAIGSRRTRPGSFAALCVSYYNSATYKALVPTTQKTYRRIVEKIRIEAAEKSVAALTRKEVQRLVDNRAAPHPMAAKMFLKVMRSLMRHAIAMELIENSPCDGVKGPKVRSKGFHTWTEDDIEKFEERHPRGTKPRLALILLLYTGQRRGDVVQLGRQHLTPNGIRVRQSKTGTELTIPVHSELESAIADLKNNLTFLLTEYARPFSSAGFGNAMRDWCDQANLRHCSAHGLRKAACRRLAEAGCSASQIAAISGHRSLAEVERYVRDAEQLKLANDAMKKINGGKN